VKHSYGLWVISTFLSSFKVRLNYIITSRHCPDIKVLKVLNQLYFFIIRVCGILHGQCTSDDTNTNVKAAVISHVYKHRDVEHNPCSRQR
jgi:hypothetical protein